MANVVRKTFTASGTFTAPAGVTRITVQASQALAQTFSSGVNCAAIDNSGNAYGWGHNNFGEIGDGTIVQKSSPTPVVGGFRFKQISTNAQNFTIGLAIDGKVYAWGQNPNGNLGDGTTTNRSSPVPVLGGILFRKIASGGFNNLCSVGIAEDGTAYAWGQNNNGQLGVGDTTPRSSPVAVLGGLKFKTISVTGDHLVGITTDGKTYAWGLNDNGQLGVGDTTPRSSPVLVLGGLNFDQVAAGHNHCLGVTTGGAVYSWGQNTFGQLGLGDVTPRSSPIAVIGGFTFAKVFAGGTGGNNTGQSFAIDRSGKAYAWGSNNFGQLGLGDVTPRSSPVAVIGGLTFDEITTMNSSQGKTLDGNLYGWGFNTDGEIGDNTVVFKSSPVAVVGGFTFKQVATIPSFSEIFTVTPGSAYPIDFLTRGAFFNGILLGNGGPSYQVDIYYSA